MAVAIIKDYLIKSQKIGLLLVDSRSTQSSSVQDRRLIDAYREWHSFRNIADHNLIGLPWFGFSAFYGGLQLSDFCSYLISINKDDTLHRSRKDPVLVNAYGNISHIVSLKRIPE